MAKQDALLIIECILFLISKYNINWLAQIQQVLCILVFTNALQQSKLSVVVCHLGFILLFNLVGRFTPT